MLKITIITFCLVTVTFCGVRRTITTSTSSRTRWVPSTSSRSSWSSGSSGSGGGFIFVSHSSGGGSGGPYGGGSSGAIGAGVVIAVVVVGLLCWAFAKGCADTAQEDGHFETVTTTTTTVVDEYDDGRPPTIQTFSGNNVTVAPPQPSFPKPTFTQQSAPAFDAPPTYSDVYNK